MWFAEYSGFVDMPLLCFFWSMQKTWEKKCTMCSSVFEIFQEHIDFLKKISPKFADHTAHIPLPDMCPECRLRRRLAFRNERNLYRRICDATNKTIISIYHPDQPYTVFDHKVRRWDSWDVFAYSQDIDFGVSFAQQYWALMLRVPRASIINDNGITSENCEYTNDFLYGKNCYMCFEMWDCEDCLYSHHSNGSKVCIDTHEASKCEDCYDVSCCTECMKCLHSIWLRSCVNCCWSSYLTWCSYCLMCSWLENEAYRFLNQVVSKDEFVQILQRLKNDKEFYETSLQAYQEIIDESKSDIIVRSEYCTGYNVSNSQHLHQCTNSFYSQRVSYGLSLYEVKDCMDIQCRKSEYCYEWQTLDESYASAFCSWCNNVQNAYYCDNCFNSSHLFGCVWLRDAQYCIFNKQYTKEEYEHLVPKLVDVMRQNGEWWKFFDPQVSPYGYNETVAQEYFPLGQESEAIGLWYKRSKYKKPQPDVSSLISAKQLPDIENVSEEVCTYAIACAESWQPFRVTKNELKFYKRHGIQLPVLHPDVRHRDRVRRR